MTTHNIKQWNPATLERREEFLRKGEDSIFWDDIGIARLFVEQFEDSLRFGREEKRWLYWTGTHWQRDLSENIARMAIRFAQELYSRIGALTQTNTDFGAAQRQIRRSNSMAGLRSFLEIAKSFLTVTNAELDRDPYFLNCANGTIDLRTGAMKPHDPGDLITKIVPHEFDESAQSGVFKEFLSTIQPDPNIRKFLQHSIGYSLLGVSRERTFWILYGNGNNGKSVFIDLFSELLRDYASATTSSSVMHSRNERIPNDIARLAGKRFIVIPETEENERLNAALIKALSSGDRITARFLFGEYFDFYFSGKLWIATNHKPTITDHSKGFWDRLKLIPFTVDIPKERIIKRDNLLKNLLDEAPGILNWAVRGAREYFAADDLSVPESIRAEIAAYKYEQDSIAQFLDECCALGDAFTVDNGRIYKKYVEFCRDNGEFQRTQRRFTQNLKERGFVQKRDAARYWEGLMLRQ